MPTTWEEHAVKQREMESLVKRLAQMDKERDAIRAQIADLSLLCADPPWGSEKEAEWRASQQDKVDRRAARRSVERAYGRLVPPGPWDTDLDSHIHEGVITKDLGDGYIGQVRLNRDLGWNGYITVPKGHRHWGKSYDDLGRFTYSAAAADRDIEGGGWTFGYCHDGEGGDTVPRSWRCYEARNYWNGESRNGRCIDLATFQPVSYLTSEDVLKELEGVKRSLMTDEERDALDAREAEEAAAVEVATKVLIAALEAKWAAEEAAE